MAPPRSCVLLALAPSLVAYRIFGHGKAGRDFTTMLLSQALFAQTSPDSTKCLAIRQLAIESSSIPGVVREQIIGQFQRSERCAIGPNADYSGFPARIQADIQRSFQDQGYYKAFVGTPMLLLVSEQVNLRIVDVTVAVNEGLQYRLGETKGYANTDDSSRVADVTFDLVEGDPYAFGALTLDGPEPHPGAAEVLLKSWKALEGKPYNRAALEQWAVDNWSSLPVGMDFWSSIRQTIRQPSHTVSVRLSFR